VLVPQLPTSPPARSGRTTPTRNNAGALTAQGRERARRKLAEADARHTPAEREQMRQDFLNRLDAA